jgi:hypothetical protein
MPEVQEVFRMATQKVRPEPGALERQLENQRRRSRRRKTGVLALAAALGLVAIALIVGSRGGQDSTTPAIEPPTVNPVDATAVEIATGFVEAYGAFDVEQVSAYLADGVEIDEVTASGQRYVQGTREELRLRLSFLEATGYKVMLDSCEELSTSATNASVRCTFDYHQLRSDEIGLGPFSGSYFDLWVRDGQIVRVSKYWDTEGYSAQVWGPFTTWVSTTYPEDAGVMYEGEGVRLTEESIRLWERHSREYVREVGP